MATCPKGHQSAATDYCDECGAPISAAGSAGTGSVPAGSAATPGPAGAGANGPAAPGPNGATAGPGRDGAAAGAGVACPDCGSPQTGRFCEVCGHDFLLEGLNGAPESAPRPAAAGSETTGGAVPDPVGGAAQAPGAAGAVGAASAGAAPVATVGAASMGAASAGTAGAVSTGASGDLPHRPAAVGGWRVVVAADAAYHARMRASAAEGAEEIAFPAFCPERRFVLQGGQVLIGRHSRSRGIEPGIDLTGPPEDAAVSHAHALLVADADGGWAVVDLDSANGTYLNDADDPIQANTPVPLTDGDRIHVGAWTTLTLQRA
jgi:hypothetical protein